MTGEPRSPWFARSILGLLLPDRYRDNQLGDLEEEFRARGRRDGWAKARRWYWFQAATSLPGTGPGSDTASSGRTIEDGVEDL